MGGPGSEGPLERGDGQIQVRPRPGRWHPPNVEGEVGGSRTGEVLVLPEGDPSVSSPGRSQPPLGRDAAAPSRGPEEGRKRPAGQSAYAGERVLCTSHICRLTHAPCVDSRGKGRQAHAGEAQRNGVPCLRPHRKRGAGI